MLPSSRLSQEIVLPVLNLVGPRWKPVSLKHLHLFDRYHSRKVLIGLSTQVSSGCSFDLEVDSKGNDDQ